MRLTLCGLLAASSCLAAPVADTTAPATSVPALLEDGLFCARSDECDSKCCSTEKSADNRYRCVRNGTKGMCYVGGGGRQGEYNEKCTSSYQCSTGTQAFGGAEACCSSEKSPNDGLKRCIAGGNRDLCVDLLRVGDVCWTTSQCASNCCGRASNAATLTTCLPDSMAFSPQCVGIKPSWTLCEFNSECHSTCCSKEYSTSDNLYKCTPGGRPELCTGSAAKPKPFQPALFPTAAMCLTNEQCQSGCCAAKPANASTLVTYACAVEPSGNSTACTGDLSVTAPPPQAAPAQTTKAPDAGKMTTTSPPIATSTAATPHSSVWLWSSIPLLGVVAATMPWV